MIGFDQPFRERLVAHFVESSQHEDDVENAISRTAMSSTSAVKPETLAYGDQPTTSR